VRLWSSSLVSPHAEAWGYSNSLTLNPSPSGRRGISWCMQGRGGAERKKVWIRIFRICGLKDLLVGGSGHRLLSPPMLKHGVILTQRGGEAKKKSVPRIKRSVWVLLNLFYWIILLVYHFHLKHYTLNINFIFSKKLFLVDIYLNFFILYSRAASQI